MCRSRTLAQNVQIFIARLLKRSVFVFSLNLLGLLITLQKCIIFAGKPPHIIDIEKGIFRLNMLITIDKYFHTLDIISFCKSLIVSSLVLFPVPMARSQGWVSL